METLEQEHHQSTTTTVPDEIIDDILSRLPVKSILRFRSVSKPWLSRISDPSFTKLHSTDHHHTGLFISAYDESPHKHHILSAACDGGPVTHLLTIDCASDHDIPVAEHLNGLVFFNTVNVFTHSAKANPFVINPSRRKFFRLPHPYTDRNRIWRVFYYFGFDESRNEHKVLMIRKFHYPTRFEVMIFSLSTCSWRKIDAEFPIGFSWDHLHFYSKSVCVNSVIHLLCQDNLSLLILAFDLRTEMVSVINVPQVSVPHYDDEEPCIIKTNGRIGVVDRDYNLMLENNEMLIWILQDYENRVWVKEIIAFPEPWIELGGPYPNDSVNMDEIIFRSGNLSEDVTSLLVYNKRSRNFKSLQFTPGHQFPFSTSSRFSLIRCYVESMLPL
ncbi:putative F-box domain-containing protein [Helianthus annuus]|nr:putative F-box domain-containing protein [Helianthus annuus]